MEAATAVADGNHGEHDELARECNAEDSARYSKLVARRTELQERVANYDGDLRQYALNPSLYKEEQTQGIREQYRAATKELHAIVGDIDTLLALSPSLRRRLEGKEHARNAAAQGARQDRDSTEGQSSAVLARLADVTPTTILWGWRGRTPLGKVTVLDGDPGLGKSLLSIDLGARTSTRQPMPDGTASDLSEPAGVVILSAEDDLADTIRPRLEAAGADLSRIVALTAIAEGKDERFPTLLDLDEIRRAIASVNARLVIIDPLMAYLPGKVDSHRDQDIRRSLAPLAALAAETGVAVLVIRHLNKNVGGNALYRGGGSIGIIGAARSGLLVAKDPEDEDRRILVVTKSNLAKTPPALAYRITVTADEVPYLSWEGATDHTAASLLAQTVDGEDRSTLEEAKDFLRAVLANGAVLATEVEKEARQVGINPATVRRAKTALKVISRKQGGFFSRDKENQRWFWLLPPSQPQPTAEDAQDPPEDAHTREHEHLQQSSEKNTRNFNGVAEDAQISECEHLQGANEHLQGSLRQQRAADAAIEDAKLASPSRSEALPWEDEL